MTVRIELLCSRLASKTFEETAARYGAAEPLARILRAVRAGDDASALESELDAIDDAFARHGIDNVTSGTRAYFPTTGGSHPTLRARVCPAAHPCSRVLLGAADPAPICAITGRPLAAVNVKG